MSATDWGSFLNIFKNVINAAVAWMSDIVIGPLNLWHWILGLWGFSLMLIAVRFFSGLSGPGLSYGINTAVEASRHHDNRGVYATNKAKKTDSDIHRVRWNDVQHGSNL